MLRGTKILTHNKFTLRNDCLVRSKHSNEGLKLQPFGQVPSRSSYHHPQTVAYPPTKQLPLPLNIEDLALSEKLKFSPQRHRDITSSYISSSSSTFTDDKAEPRLPVDERIELYDCSGTINLSSAMQTNVPFPFVSSGKPMHLNMPGGQWGQKEKYVSEELNKFHHTNTQELNGSVSSVSLGNKTGAINFYCCSPGRIGSHFNALSSFSSLKGCHFRKFCTTAWAMTDKVLDKDVTVSNKKHYVQKLKMAVKEYGPVIIVFHITFSLMSLGVCYLLISSGIDLSSILKDFGVGDGADAAGTAAGFIVAYGIHKALAPVRVGVTLSVAPFIVRKLRKQKWWPGHRTSNASSNCKTQKTDSQSSQTTSGPTG